MHSLNGVSHAELTIRLCGIQVRHADSGAVQDALAQQHGNEPSAAALKSMLSNDICQEHVSGQS